MLNRFYDASRMLIDKEEKVPEIDKLMVQKVSYDIRTFQDEINPIS